jgi:hypothetical protein
MGNDIPSSNALVLCNLLTISFFYKVLSYAIGQSIDGFRTRRYLWEANGSGLIILASSMVYTYQTAIAMVNLPWLTLGERNNNLLTLINSGINFGNNTFALALSFLGYFSLVEFRKTSLNSWAATAVLCWSLVLGYSITLCFTLGLAGFLTFVSGKIKKPLLLSALSLCIVSIIYLLFHQLGYFDGGQGARLAFGFDDGRFIQNAIFSFPLIMIGLLLAVHQGLNWFSKQLCIGVVVCFLIPSLIYIKGTGTLSDFSMKTSSLMVAMGGTVAVSSFHRFLFLRSAGRIWRLGVILLVFCGLANTAAYVLQFPYYRIINPDIRFEAISLNYFNSLKYIRLYAKQDSLLIDGMGYHRISVVPPVMIAERRILKLPDNDRNNMNPAPIEGVNDITSDNWKNWASSGFKDKIASEYFAGKSEYFLTLVPMASSSWRLEAKFGDVMIYKSLDYN